MWRHEKHINRESYILLFGEYHVNILVGIVLCLLFFGNCIGYVLLYPLVFLINIVTRCMYPIPDNCHHSGMLVGYIGIGILWVGVLSGICCQCSDWVFGLDVVCAGS